MAEQLLPAAASDHREASFQFIVLPPFPTLPPTLTRHSKQNALMQRDFGPLYVPREFDEIALGLSPDSWICPHKSWLGTGNYDVNVLLAALQLRGLDATWHDARTDTRSIDTTDPA